MARIPILNPYEELYLELKDAEPKLLLQIRKKLIWAYSWAIPSSVVMTHLTESFSSWVEIGAGSGYWSWCLSQSGTDVIALDRNPQQPPLWTDVKQGGPEELAQFSDRTLLLCWPSYQSPFAFDCLKAFKGQNVVYVGEWRGRTADTAFHDELEKYWNKAAELEIPNWPGFKDRVYILRRSLENR